MLSHRVLASALLAFVIGVVGAPGAIAGPTQAPPGGGSCDQQADPTCAAWGNGNGGPGTGGGGGAGNGGGCTWQGQPVPCVDPQYGTYTGGGCYWSPSPIQGSPPPGRGGTPGTWGVQTCYSAPGSTWVTQTVLWRATAVAAPGPTPQQLAREALTKIHLLGARIGTAPSPTGSGLVELPVWLWTAVTPGTWGPLSASASGGGITVTITARASRIVWDMGDGHQVTCGNPGTPYSPGYGFAESPTCPYTYTTPSSTLAHPHSRYTITATTYWSVQWAGGGQSGVLTPTSQSQSSVEIGEVQVVGR